MKYKFVMMFVTLAMTGCASSNMVTYKVNSTPPNAQVDVNGTSLGKTPTEIHLQCSKRWVGVINAPGGWAYDNSVYEVTVYPSSQNSGFSQTKRVNPCQWQGKTTPELNFDLGLRQINPTTPVDLNITNNTPQPKNQPPAQSLEDTLANLRKLRDEGILSESEYKDKVVKATEMLQK